MRLLISDPTLRDGNHAVAQGLRAQDIAWYCAAAEAAGIPVVEVGHGNGLGASSLLIGESLVSDQEAIAIARKQLKTAKLGVHSAPGFSTIEKDLKPALALGVDSVRVAAHCTEADLCGPHLEFLRKNKVEAVGVLMMSHRISPEELTQQAKILENSGAERFVFMDSAGHFLPDEITQRVCLLKQRLSIPIGFHAHNNLSLAVANSLAAVKAGASSVDACTKGFGAGAGNTQLEVLVAVLHRLGFETGINLTSLLKMAEEAGDLFLKPLPSLGKTSILSGLTGVVSTFLKPVEQWSKQFGVDPREALESLASRGVIAGQEDMILEVVQEIAAKKKLAEV